MVEPREADGRTALKSRQFDIKEIGLVREVKGMVARIVGLPSCISGQLVTFSSGVLGMIMGYDLHEAHALILGDAAQIRTGEQPLNIISAI